MTKTKISLTLMMVMLFVCGCWSVVEAQEYWAKTYGGGGSEYSYMIFQTTDGGYIKTGPTTSYGAGSYDFWIVKLDAAGSIVWQKVIGGTGDEIPNDIDQTSDGGYIVLGRTTSFGAGQFDYYLIRLDAAGNLVWQRTYGTNLNEYAYGVQQTSDGGYILAGAMYATASNIDFWLLKLTSTGTVTWQRRYGGTGVEWPYAVQQTADGGYVAAGYTSSSGAGSNDVWLLKLDASGNITWQRAYGGTGADLALSVHQTSDNGYILLGRTESFGAGGIDFWVIRIDSTGTIVWQKTFGGNGTDWGFKARQVADGSYILVGQTTSFGAGVEDYWIIKLDASGNSQWQRTFGGAALDYAYSVAQANDGSFLVGGVCASFGSGGYDTLFLKLNASGNVGSSVCSMMGTTNVSPITPSPTTTSTSFNYTATTVSPGTPTPIPVIPTATMTTYCYFISGAPGRVLNTLLAAKSGTNIALSWLAPGGTCSPTAYGLYRGTLPWTTYNHASVTCGIASTSYSTPSGTGSYYYLIVPLNATNEGSYGRASSGSEIPQGSSPCLTQSLTVCN